MLQMSFKVGVRVIPAPLPGKSLQDNVKQLMQTHPVFRWTTVLDSDGEVLADGSIQYTVVQPPVKANG
ncbi:hypothetical protein [Rheinheimera hassiensis]|uniref:hypothetical protein n=1 Tax=Rheinheimera hassiensis TaxID=1193627 RepID=UPI001F070D45|nr:hypothetical protein [Rheinheimera hassiensis]